MDKQMQNGRQACDCWSWQRLDKLCWLAWPVGFRHQSLYYMRCTWDATSQLCSCPHHTAMYVSFYASRHPSLSFKKQSTKSPSIVCHSSPHIATDPCSSCTKCMCVKIYVLHTGRGESLLHDGRLQQLLGHDVLPVMRLLHAQMAASCAHLAKLLLAHKGHQKVCMTHCMFLILQVLGPMDAVTCTKLTKMHCMAALLARPLNWLTMDLCC